MKLLKQNVVKIALCASFACHFSGCESVMSIENDKAAIWALEQEIYAKRAQGDVKFYIDLSNEAYLGWPFGLDNPTDMSGLRSYDAENDFPVGEDIRLVSNGISIDGDTAISYYSTHRTRMPGGDTVDQRFENIHVWVRRAGKWTLIGSLSRKTQ